MSFTCAVETPSANGSFCELAREHRRREGHMSKRRAQTVPSARPRRREAGRRRTSKRRAQTVPSARRPWRTTSSAISRVETPSTDGSFCELRSLPAERPDLLCRNAGRRRFLLRDRGGRRRRGTSRRSSPSSLRARRASPTARRWGEPVRIDEDVLSISPPHRLNFRFEVSVMTRRNARRRWGVWNRFPLRLADEKPDAQAGRDRA